MKGANFKKNFHLKLLSPISLHYKTGPNFPDKGAILKIKGHICPWPFPISKKLEIRLTHLSLTSFLWDIGKQNSPRCDAAILFA